MKLNINSMPKSIYKSIRLDEPLKEWFEAGAAKENRKFCNHVFNLLDGLRKDSQVVFKVDASICPDIDAFKDEFGKEIRTIDQLNGYS